MGLGRNAVRQATFVETVALVAVVGSTVAGVHYDGIWGGVAAGSAALLVFSMIHELSMIHALLMGVWLSRLGKEGG